MLLGELRERLEQGVTPGAQQLFQLFFLTQPLLHGLELLHVSDAVKESVHFFYKSLYSWEVHHEAFRDEDTSIIVVLLGSGGH